MDACLGYPHRKLLRLLWMGFSCSLILGFVGTLSVRSGCYEKYLCREGGEPSCLVFSVLSVLLFLIFMLVQAGSSLKHKIPSDADVHAVF